MKQFNYNRYERRGVYNKRRNYGGMRKRGVQRVREESDVNHMKTQVPMGEQ